MVSKGTDIPELLPASSMPRRAAAIAAVATASLAFEEWAGIGAGELPLEDVDAMQVQLMRWQIDRFGHVPTSDPIMALGVVEELGEVFDDDATAEDAIDGLGDVMIYGAQLCTGNRLALRPVIDLAMRYALSNLPSPIAIIGRFAHVVGKHEQRTRGLAEPGAWRLCLVDALAMVIAKALEDCSIGHELRIDPGGVFTAIGKEVIGRKPGDVMIPAPLVAAANVAVHIDADADADVQVVEEIPPRHLMSHTHAKHLSREGLAAGMDGLTKGVAMLEEAERVEGAGDFDISDVANHTGICPQCAAVMSYDGSKPLYTCSNGHSLTPKQMASLQQTPEALLKQLQP